MHPWDPLSPRIHLRAPCSFGKEDKGAWAREETSLGQEGLSPLWAAVPTSAAAMWTRWGTHCEAWKEDVLLVEEFQTRKLLGSLTWIPVVIDH